MNLQQLDLGHLLEQYEKICLQEKNQRAESQNYQEIQEFLNNIQIENQNEKNKESFKYLRQFFNVTENPQQIIIKTQKEQISEDSSEQSDTISLSLINDQQQSYDLKNYLDWQLVLEKYGDFFRPVSYFNSYIRANKFENILNNIRSFKVVSEGTLLYQGFNKEYNQWIVLREQEVGNNSVLESAEQYIIHDLIYKLYPNKFLKLLLPVYIETNEFDQTKFISQIEFGEINLYTYSQQNKIEDKEFQSIFQQIYEQISLLHKHNIAHRDIKPQNIIYVENKGWLLCDFGDSVQYDNVIGIYSIRGTYAFLQPYLQHKSKIQGIMIKQNLFENDIYALAVTLIMIKYQLKVNLIFFND